MNYKKTVFIFIHIKAICLYMGFFLMYTKYNIILVSASVANIAKV